MSQIELTTAGEAIRKEISNRFPMSDEVKGYVDDKASLLQSNIDAVEAGQISGVIGYATKSAMDSDTGQDVNTIAIVTNDTAENNGYYRWDGDNWIASDFLGSDVLLFTDSLTEENEPWEVS